MKKLILFFAVTLASLFTSCFSTPESSKHYGDIINLKTIDWNVISLKEYNESPENSGIRFLDIKKSEEFDIPNYVTVRIAPDSWISIETLEDCRLLVFSKNEIGFLSLLLNSEEFKDVYHSPKRTTSLDELELEYRVSSIYRGHDIYIWPSPDHNDIIDISTEINEILETEVQ